MDAQPSQSQEATDVKAEPGPSDQAVDASIQKASQSKIINGQRTDADHSQTTNGQRTALDQSQITNGQRTDADEASSPAGETLITNEPGIVSSDIKPLKEVESGVDVDSIKEITTNSIATGNEVNGIAQNVAPQNISVADTPMDQAVDACVSKKQTGQSKVVVARKNKADFEKICEDAVRDLLDDGAQTKPTPPETTEATSETLVEPDQVGKLDDDTKALKSDEEAKLAPDAIDAKEESDNQGSGQKRKANTSVNAPKSLLRKRLKKAAPEAANNEPQQIIPEDTEKAGSQVESNKTDKPVKRGPGRPRKDGKPNQSRKKSDKGSKDTKAPAVNKTLAKKLPTKGPRKKADTKASSPVKTISPSGVPTVDEVKVEPPKKESLSPKREAESPKKETQSPLKTESDKIKSPEHQRDSNNIEKNSNGAASIPITNADSTAKPRRGSGFLASLMGNPLWA